MAGLVPTKFLSVVAAIGALYGFFTGALIPISGADPLTNPARLELTPHGEVEAPQHAWRCFITSRPWSELYAAKQSEEFLIDAIRAEEAGSSGLFFVEAVSSRGSHSLYAAFAFWYFRKPNLAEFPASFHVVFNDAWVENLPPLSVLILDQGRVLPPEEGRRLGAVEQRLGALEAEATEGSVLAQLYPAGRIADGKIAPSNLSTAVSDGCCSRYVS